MSDGVKTSIFAGIAGLLALVAWLSVPRQQEASVEALKDKVLFPEFNDPAKASSLEIVRYDSKLGELHTFKVARNKSEADAWTIPSHAGYPADAKDRMRDAALMLVDLRILGVASQEKKDHKLYGVVTPDKDKLEVGSEDVGDLITLEDQKSKQLATLVVGKKVRGADGQRFVRIPPQDVVYAVKIDPDKLSTKFEDWIEKDLLKLSAFDVETVQVKNYSVARAGNQVALDQKFDILAKLDNNEWKLQELTTYRDNLPVKGELAPGEELNKEKLNELKDSAAKLAIVDVRRKPKGLGADLKAGESFMKDREGVEDLFKRGFYPVRIGKNDPELLSANGEVHVTVKEGVQYVLRFGESLSGTGEEGEGQNRYLFAMARVDMSKFPEPELQTLPELPGGKKPEAPEGKKEEAKPSEGTAAKPTAAEADADKAKTETSSTDSKPEVKPEAKPAETPPAEAAAPKDTPKPAEAKPEGEKQEAPAKKEGDAKPADASKEATESEIAKERERITKENQKKIDERNEKLKKAKEKVADLNLRFADWYYVVSDKEYKKIHLDRDEVIKKSDKAKEEGDDPEAFRKLEQEGLKK